MAGWQTHQGRAVHLPLNNVDTDQLIPARFMSVPRAQGYGPYLMHDLRRDGQGALDAGFALNNATGASVLIAGRNFGTGSSREAAVYALVDAGFRAVIAPSFGDIFASNAVNNGLLPAIMAEPEQHQLLALLEGDAEVSIDLVKAAATVGGQSIGFSLQSGWREKLINGWDDIDLTLQHGAKITGYRAARAKTPWAWPQV